MPDSSPEDLSKYPGESNLTHNDRASQWLFVIRDLLAVVPMMSAITLRFFVDKAMRHIDEGHK